MIVLGRKNYQKCRTIQGAVCLMNPFRLRNTAGRSRLFAQKYMTWVGEQLIREKMSEELLESLGARVAEWPDEIKCPKNEFLYAKKGAVPSIHKG